MLAKKTLQQIGLNNLETKIFLALLKCDIAPASVIAEKAGVNRVVAYETLLRLVERGLAHKTFKTGRKVQHFEAEGLETIEFLLEQQAETAKHVFERFVENKQLLRDELMPSSAKPSVEFYSGKEGIKRVLMDTLKVKPREILSFAAPESLLAGFDKKFLQKYWDKRLAMKLPTRGILPDTEKARSVFTKEKNISELRHVKWTKESSYPFRNEIDIYGNSVGILSFEKGNEHGVIIRSKDIAESYRGLFEMMWSLLPDERSV